jgi:hypothetical protein
MGMFRPWFVGTGKDSSPAFYAPKKTEHVFSLTRAPDGTRVIGVYTGSDEPLGLPDQGSSGEISFEVPATEASSLSVSLSVHKLAYLVLLLAQPGLVFDPVFDDLRSFLCNPSESNYRPFREEMIEGATPGVSIHFLVEMLEEQPESSVSKRVFLPERVYVVLKIHHMIYSLALAGELPAGDWGAATLKGWQPPSDVQWRMKTITFGFGAKRRTK